MPGLPSNDGDGISSSPTSDVSPPPLPSRPGMASSSFPLYIARKVDSNPFISNGGGSAESEHDLAAMVHDFMENGSCGTDFYDSSDSDHGGPTAAMILETILALKSPSSSLESDLSHTITALVMSMKDMDLSCLNIGTECKGACIRRLLAKHLKVAGYDAGVCSSKWPNSGKVPRGEYEYLDVILRGDTEKRVIVDIDFQTQFEIARPTHTYVSTLKSLPTVFVGALEKLERILQVMAEAAKLSLKQNSMPLPPWRTLDYMSAKWMSPYERTIGEGIIRRGRDHIRTKQCAEQLRYLKTRLPIHTDKLYQSNNRSTTQLKAKWIPLPTTRAPRKIA